MKCIIRSIAPVGNYLHMVLDAPEIDEVAPGHFAAVSVGGIGGGMLLRRAFSIHKSTPGDSIEIIFAAHGQGTQWLATQSAGDEIDIIAPLGKPFVLPRQPISCVIVAGGYGAAPMELLARELRGRGCRVDVVLGAATQERSQHQKTNGHENSVHGDARLAMVFGTHSSAERINR